MQLYARVFVQILDSSIAEDFECRHVFEDLLKVCDTDGCIDVTRTALARRFNIPLTVLNRCLQKLEQPDPLSRDPDNEGRRLERLDEHRDWGWRILNWAKYEAVRNRAMVADRVARHRQKNRLERPGGAEIPETGDKTPGEAPENGAGGSGSESGEVPGAKSAAPVHRGGRRNRPESIEACIEQGKMLNIPELVCRDFFLYNDARAQEGMNGEPIWMTGGEHNQVPVGNWVTLLKGWETKEHRFQRRRRPILTDNSKDVPSPAGPPIEVKKVVKTTPVLPPPSTPNLTYAQS